MQQRWMDPRNLTVALAVVVASWLWPAAVQATSPSMDPDGYTIQLIALPTAERLENFVRDRGVPDLVATKIVRDGAIHYVLLMGSFADKASALNAAKKLPSALQDLKPWVRPMASLLAAAPR